MSPPSSVPVTPATPESIRGAAEVIRQGGLVAFPTETVYGLGGDAFNAKAVARIFEAKSRPRFDPLIAHIASADALETLVTEVPDAAGALIDRFWPGPLTVVLPKRDEVPDLVTAGLPTVAVRCPDHPVALEFIEACDTAIAAPSANRFTEVSPTTAAHVRDSLGAVVDMILDGGPCAVGVESTVVRLDADGAATVLRPGGVSLEALREVVERVEVGAPVAGGDAAREAPGMLARHYAPKTRLDPVEAFDAATGDKGARIGGLAFEKDHHLRASGAEFEVIEVLSAAGDPREAAANLFAAMRRLDAAKLDRILFEFAPEHGLGVAINDRLRRASHRATGGRSSRD
ncbi:MAG: L-threonylcarbamoyladenylate synthase [Phycisphaerales bacterium]